MCHPVTKFQFCLVLVALLLLSDVSIADDDTTKFCEKDNLDDCENSVQLQIGIIDESLNQLDQEDFSLIEAIKKRLLPIPAADVPYNFSNPLELNGQFNLTDTVSDLFKDQKTGFFIEAGAYDGELFSNSLFYELKLGWKGLLVEPNPDPLAELIQKQRKANIFGHCFSSKRTPEVVDFDAAGLFGGIINEGKRPGDNKDDVREIRNMPKNFKPKFPFNRRTIRVQCFPVYSVLMALGNPTVDLFSLDIEGAEFPVLQTIPWDKVNIRVLLIEINHVGDIFEGNRFQMRKLLKDNGYKLHKSTGIDEIYVKRKF